MCFFPPNLIGFFMKVIFWLPKEICTLQMVLVKRSENLSRVICFGGSPTFYNSNLKLHSIQKSGIIFYFRSSRFKFRWKWLLPSKQCCNCCKMGQKRRKSSENSHRWFGCAPWTINAIQFLWRSKCFIFLHTQVKYFKNHVSIGKNQSIFQPAKGQLISKGLVKVFICTKKRTKIFLLFCPCL